MIARSLSRRTVGATLLTAAVASVVLAAAAAAALHLLWVRHDAAELERTADAVERIYELETAEGEHGAEESAREALVQGLGRGDRGVLRAGASVLAERGVLPAGREGGDAAGGWISTRRVVADGVVLELARHPEQDVPLRRLFWASLLVAAIPSSLVALAVGRAAGRAVARPIEDLARRLGEVHHPRDFSPAAPGSLSAEGAALESAFAAVLGRLDAALEREASFATNAAHELRTPLTRIRLRAERAASRVSGECRAELAAITSEVDRLTRLADALLVLARDETTGLGEAETVNLADVVRAAASAGERAVELVAPDEALVRGDEALLRLAVENLLDNARKYAPAGHTPAARLSAEAASVVLSVETPGVVLSPEERAMAFERFYRGPQAREVAGGHGLGLALARHVARVHGGDVGASDGAPGREVFELRLPVWRGAAG